jgi:hypothetical protein
MFQLRSLLTTFVVGLCCLVGWLCSQQHRYPVSLPDILRPKANDPHQLRVYDDYTRLRSIAASAAKADAAGANATTPTMPGGVAGTIASVSFTFVHLF